MENMTRKKKRKSRYSVVLVSHSPEKGLKQFFLSSWYARTALFLIGVLLIGLAAYGVKEGILNSSALQGSSKKVDELNTQITDLNTENDTLTAENADLKDKNAILVTTVNEKLAEEEATAAKYVPSGFPILGTTSIIEEPPGTTVEQTATATDATTDTTAVVTDPTTDPNYVPIVVFEAAKDVEIIASGNGTVTAIEPDGIYGYTVYLDHGNGYISIYRFSSAPSVRVGDEITRGTMLGKTSTESEKVGYEITKDGAYINPMDIMEIYG